MSEPSEFEKYKYDCLTSAYGGPTYADGIREGMDLAREWFLNKAKSISITNDPMISDYILMSDLEKACK